MEGSGRLFLIQRAGWGKSAVYFITAKLLREGRLGPTLIISPLLALMRNQIDAAERMGVRAVTINSSNQEDWHDAKAKIDHTELDVLLVSPERFKNHKFVTDVFPKLASSVSMMVVDEAHCISDWGHDFRPQYRRLRYVLTELPANVCIVATTATSNSRVVNDVSETLGGGLKRIRGSLALPAVSLQTIRLASQGERLAWLAEQLPYLPGSGIIYALTKSDAEKVASFLQQRGINAHAYHSKLDNDAKLNLESELISNQVKALVATTALGMGFDKPDLRFVIHYQCPSSPIAYYQQVGRAGRAVSNARGVLLSGSEEDDINEYFIKSAFPTRHEVGQVLDVLEGESEGMSEPQISARANIGTGRIAKALLLLSNESPSAVAKLESGWHRLATPRPSDDFWERVDRVTMLRRDEQRAMKTYVDLDSGHMEFLLDQLDSRDEVVASPPLRPLPSVVNPTKVNDANRFLKRQWLKIEPRKRWPTGFTAHGGRATMEHGLINAVGKVLSVYGDGGWGGDVQSQKYQGAHFNDELVNACVEMFREWSPDPAPTWVASVPSRSGSDMVSSFAKRMSSQLGMPIATPLIRTGTPHPQKSMQNSYHQARNAWDCIQVEEAKVLEGPVLLIDDIVDSRWTFTVAGYKLRQNGSGPVYPLALAQATSGD